MSAPVAVPRVLSVAGTDPTGGAGVQADLKTIAALGGYGMAVVTALVAQNTRGVRAVHVPPPAFLGEQLRAVSDDVEIDAVKIGMLHSTPLVAEVAAWLADAPAPLVVLDPVMVATSGDRLLDAEATRAVRELCCLVDLVTPNLPELAVLLDEDAATTWPAAVDQASRLAGRIGTTVLLKGGHLAGSDCPDAVVDATDVSEVGGRRVRTRSTHGTGCSLSSALATLAAGGLGWTDALRRAKSWLSGAVEHGEALRVGRGNGPVDHLHELRPHLPTTSWCDEAWRRTADARADIDGCAFVRGLADGTLDPTAFDRFLVEDSAYLTGFARALAQAAALAPGPTEQVFWSRAATTAVETEAELHRSRLGPDRVVGPAPSATTLAYLGHLSASASSYAEVVAAVLPCFWVYSDLGDRLVSHDRPGHPFHDWLSAYADPAFGEATRGAVALVDAAARDAGGPERARMRLAFDRSVAHELAFFAAPLAAVAALSA